MPTTGAPEGRIPQQARSRQKVAAILENAIRLFQESGMDTVSMREIARGSGMPIATLYQYFPSKQAIVRRIWEDHTEEIGRLLEAELTPLITDSSPEAIWRVIERIVDSYAEVQARNPAFLEIRRCVEATPDLRQLNIDNTLHVAKMIQQSVLRINPQVDPVLALNYSIIGIEATSATAKLGQEMPEDQREQLLTSMKGFIRQLLREVGI